MIFETHAHYDDKRFDVDRDQLLSSFPENQIQYLVNVGASLETTKKSIELAKKYDFVYASVGVHPSETAELNEENFQWLKSVLQEEKVVAVGEIGLDYYWDEPEKSIQKQWFERQMELAKEVKLPMIIHSRDAAKDTMDMIKDCKGYEAGGVIHCFSYGTEIAKEYLDMVFCGFPNVAILFSYPIHFLCILVRYSDYFFCCNPFNLCNFLCYMRQIQGRISLTPVWFRCHIRTIRLQQQSV